jgi:hypothetical protein
MPEGEDRIRNATQNQLLDLVLTLVRTPREWQRRFTEGKSVEVTGDYPFQSFNGLLPARLDGDDERVRISLHGRDAVRKTNDAAVARLLYFELVTPVLAELLKVLGTVRGWHCCGY